MRDTLRFRGFFLALLLLSSLAGRLAAQTAFSEPFDYGPAGADLLGQNGGTGFDGPWFASGFNATVHNNYDIAQGSLLFQDLVVTGNRTRTAATRAIAGLGRNLATPIRARATTTLYFSLLLRPEGTLGRGQFNGFFGCYLDGTGNAGNSDLFVGKPGSDIVGEYVLENRGGSGQVQSGVAPVVGETVLLVVRADLQPGTDVFTLYVNPDPCQPEPASGTVKSDLDIGGISALVIYSTGAFSVDELRLGSSFEAVAPCYAKEPFDYSPPGADLLGQNGGSGFAGPWFPSGFNASIHDNYDIAASSLLFQDLVVTGNRTESASTNAIAGLGRNLAAPIRAANATLYFSLLLRPEGTLGEGQFNGFFGCYLDGTGNAGNSDLFVGKPGSDIVGEYVLENRGGSGQVQSGVAPVVGETVLLVVRADLQPGTDVFTLYVNPDPCQPEPASGTVKSDLDIGGISALVVYSTGAFSLDELRLGSSFEAVVPCYAREPFDYAPPGADLLGQNGGTGFDGPWFPSGFNASIHDNYDIASSSLLFQDLVVTGNRTESAPTSAIAGLGRNLATPIPAGANATLYFSLLLRPEGTVGDGLFNGFFGVYLDGTGNADLFVGKPGSDVIGEYVLENRGGSGQVQSGVAPVAGETVLLVVRADLQPGTDVFTLYVNPDPCQPEPASGTVKSDLDLGDVSALVIYSGGAFSLDELRLGSSFGAVVPCYAKEPFDYAPPGADLLGQNGGTGFAGPWFPSGFNASIHDNYDIAADSLLFQDLAVTGNRTESAPTSAIAGLGRNLAAPIPGAANATLYFSLLLRPEGTLGEGLFNGFFGVYLDGTGNADLFVGKPGSDVVGQYVIENRGGSGQVQSGVAPVAGETVLLVVRADLQPGVDVFTLYVNPDPCQPEPVSGVVKGDLDLGSISALVIYSTGAFSVDELRLGSSFQAVVPCYAKEPFDYSPPGADLLGQNGGTGFAGPWFPSGFNASIHDNYDIAADSLLFQDLAVTGNRTESAPTSAIAGLGRNLAAPIPGAANATLYFSLLLRPEGTLGEGLFNGFFGVYLDGTGNADLFVGKPGSDVVGQYVIENRGGSGQVQSGVAPVAGETVLLVVRADLQPGVDVFTLYVNPDPCQPEPASGTVKSDLDLGSISALVIYSTGAFSVDELRLGSSFDAVAPCAVREPFEYSLPGADLLGQNGGIGFTGPWFPSGFNASIFDSYDIATGSLAFGALAVTGNRTESASTQAIAGLGRTLAVPISAGATATKYFSLLLRPEGTLGEGIFNGFFGCYLDGTGNADLFVGKPGSDAVGEYVLENRGGSGQVQSGVAPVAGETVLLVVRADLQPGTDVFTLFVNPDPCQPEPVSGTVKNDLDLGDISAIVIYSTGAFSLDELRLGSTFEAVMRAGGVDCLPLLTD